MRATTSHSCAQSPSLVPAPCYHQASVDKTSPFLALFSEKRMRIMITKNTKNEQVRVAVIITDIVVSLPTPQLPKSLCKTDPKKKTHYMR